MHTKARMEQTHNFWENWCDGKMSELGSMFSGIPDDVGPNSGNNWDCSRYEEREGFQLITLSTDRQSTLVLCDNSHRHHPYVSGYVEIPWPMLNADEDLLEREKLRLIEECQSAFQRLEVA